jgi:hypothetical protein
LVKGDEVSKKQEVVHDALATEQSTINVPGVSGIVEAGDVILVPAINEEEVHQFDTTLGKRMIPVAPPRGITVPQFKRVCSAAFMWYMHSNGELATPSTLHHAGLRSEVVERVMHSPEFVRAMLIRGIDYTGQGVLTPQQDIAMMIMVEPNGKTFAQKLRMAGISSAQWRGWLKNPMFKEVWDRIGGDVLKAHENDMLVALTGSALTGDTQAIKLAFEISGKHNPAQKKQVDAEQLLGAFIEIIQEEVHDPETLRKISTRMSLAASGQRTHRVIEA